MIEVALRHAYRDVAVEAAFRTPARVLALFGDSGAGKTTVLNAIAGLLTPRAGRIVLDGTVLFDSAAAICVPVARRQIGYVFQDGRLFPHLSARANLLYGARARGRDGVDLDRIVDLLDLGALLARMPAELSGGERQRVAIGRALLSGPRILLLDEPLTGLHREARDQVLDHLVRLKLELGLAMLLVSHQPAEVIALADEVVLMQSGTVVDQVPVERFAQRQLRR